MLYPLCRVVSPTAAILVGNLKMAGLFTNIRGVKTWTEASALWNSHEVKLHFINYNTIICICIGFTLQTMHNAIQRQWNDAFFVRFRGVWI